MSQKVAPGQSEIPGNNFCPNNRKHKYQTYNRGKLDRMSTNQTPSRTELNSIMENRTDDRLICTKTFTTDGNLKRHEPRHRTNKVPMLVL